MFNGTKMFSGMPSILTRAVPRHWNKVRDSFASSKIQASPRPAQSSPVLPSVSDVEVVPVALSPPVVVLPPPVVPLAVVAGTIVGSSVAPSFVSLVPPQDQCKQQS